MHYDIHQTSVLDAFILLIDELNPVLPKPNMIDLLKGYTDQEIELILRDYIKIRSETFQKVSYVKKYLTTAGGPGAGKTTILTRVMKEREVRYAYIDPDDCLYRMENTYQTAASRQEGYDKWRQASIFVANLLLAEALKKQCAIAFGSTLATQGSLKAFPRIKGQEGYEIEILHITSPEEERKIAVQYRLTAVDLQDVANKGKDFLRFINDYLAIGDLISFYWRPKAFEDGILAATKKKAELVIIDPSAYSEIIQQHEAGSWPLP